MKSAKKYNMTLKLMIYAGKESNRGSMDEVWHCTWRSSGRRQENPFADLNEHQDELGTRKVVIHVEGSKEQDSTNQHMFLLVFACQSYIDALQSSKKGSKFAIQLLLIFLSVHKLNSNLSTLS